MWAVFTWIYNSILILFIAVHLLVGALITFGVGVYVGIYLCQNYEIPRIDEPFKLWSYFVKFLEERRKPGGLSIFRFESFRRRKHNDSLSSLKTRDSRSPSVVKTGVSTTSLASMPEQDETVSALKSTTVSDLKGKVS